MARPPGRCSICRQYGHNKITFLKSFTGDRDRDGMDIDVDEDEDGRAPVVHGDGCVCDVCSEEYVRKYVE